MSAHPFMQFQDREKLNVVILVASQMLFIVPSITVMTLSGVDGQQHSPNLAYATLPIAIMMIGTVASPLPTSLFVQRAGRRKGVILGASLGGIGRGLLSLSGIAAGSFWLFCAGNLLIGLCQSFAMYYRFAAVEVASQEFRSKAISLVMAGGVVATFFRPRECQHHPGLGA